jgi:4-diphosphocytidyl-2-C-methyl-D-erythritol kinase
MTLFPNCKINIGLYIERKREDGFHDIKTLFYPINFNDTIEIEKTDKKNTSISIFGIPIEGDTNDNLCLKAYNLLNNDFDLPPVNIILLKRIPTGAGLGGGSSDAVHTLLLLNEMFELKISNHQLYSYANKLGSDCAFFIENKPLLASEKGSTFNEIDFSIKNHYIVLIKPNQSINTTSAYKWITPRNKQIDLESLLHAPIENWKNTVINDFEEEVFKRFPNIKDLKDRLYDYGAVYASMSGSGSAVFGIFKKIPENIEHDECYLWHGECIY